MKRRRFVVMVIAVALGACERVVDLQPIDATASGDARDAAIDGLPEGDDAQNNPPSDAPTDAATSAPVDSSTLDAALQ